MHHGKDTGGESPWKGDSNEPEVIPLTSSIAYFIKSLVRTFAILFRYIAND